MSLTPGTSLGPYEVVSALGAGGMGEVYRARDPRLGRDVAVKVLHGHVADDAASRQRFEREARAVASLSHPNIVAVFDVGTEGGVTFVVSELLEGRTLREHLRDGVPPRRALEWAAQIALGLGAAHERGIVHRDLKPENVFVADDGRVKILDFGLAQVETARTAGDTTVLTQAGTFMGTPGYASPEQVSGDAATTRSDIFALGVILYELVTGRHPFMRPTVVETLTAILREEPPAIGPVAGLPPAIAPVIDRCLRKRPSDRPASAPDLAFLLETLGTSRDTAPAPIVGPETGASPAWWPPGRLAAATAAIVLLLTVITWTYVYTASSGVARQVAEAHLERAAGLVVRVHEDRLARLRLTTSLVASLPNVVALLDTDTPTVRDALLAHQQRNPGPDVLMAFDARGALLARTDALTTEIEEPWLRAVLTADGGGAVMLLAGRPVHAAAAEAHAASTLFGYVAAARPVDDGFARLVAEAVGDDVVVLSHEAVLGSSLRGAQNPWGSLADWRAAGGTGTRSIEVGIGARRALAREVPLVSEPAVSVVIVSWDDEDAEPFRRISWGVAVIGSVSAILAALLILRLTRARATPPHS